MPIEPRLISCDEAGFTGPELLNEDQPYFAYSAIDLTPGEADIIIRAARERHRIQAPELKSKLLRKRSNWPVIALEIAQATQGRAMVISFDKRLNLAGKAFEYLFEPVLQDANSLFYRSNLHRFVMNSVHRALVASGTGIDRLELELQAFMRGFDPATASSWFSDTGPKDGPSVVLDCVQRFARGYAARIESRTTHLRADEDGIGKWSLDLTIAALFSLVWRGWGPRYPTIELICDDSKPLRATEDLINEMGEKPGGFPVTDGRSLFNVRAKLAKPVTFGSSAQHPTLQVADILAGATVDALKNPADSAFDPLRLWIEQHLHQDHIHPDNALLDMRAIGPRVNLATLRELARRADKGLDPLAGMEAFYASTYKRYRNPASRLSRPPPRKERPRNSR